jgi:hypothetical protein
MNKPDDVLSERHLAILTRVGNDKGKAIFTYTAFLENERDKFTSELKKAVEDHGSANVAGLTIHAVRKVETTIN